MSENQSSSTARRELSVIIPCEHATDAQALTCRLADMLTMDAEIVLVERMPAQPSASSSESTTLRISLQVLTTDTQLGLKAALRSGLAAAKGTTILFLRPEDSLTQECIEQAWQLVRDSAADMVDLSGGWNKYYTKISPPAGRDTLSTFAKKADTGIDLYGKALSRELAATALAPDFPQDRYDEVAALMTAHVAAFHAATFSGVDTPGFTRGLAGIWVSLEGRIMGAAALLNDFISYCSSHGWPPAACDAYADTLVARLRRDVGSFMQNAEHNAQALLAFGSEAEALRALLTGHPVLQRAVERRNAVQYKQRLKREGRLAAAWVFTAREKLYGHFRIVKNLFASS